MAKYPPLIGIDEFVRQQDGNLPIVVGPAVIADKKGNVLLWYLPNVLSAARQVRLVHYAGLSAPHILFQRKVLACTRLLEAQLTTRTPKEDDPETKGWRNVKPLFTPGDQWKAGTVLLYPAGFQLGHTVHFQI